MEQIRRIARPLLFLVALCGLALTPLVPPGARAADDGALSMGVGATGGQRVHTDVMQALKIDKKYGLDIKYSYFPGPRGMQALLTGRVEVANLGAIVSARMTNEGRHMQNFEVFFDSHISFMVPPESPIKDFWELKGKRLGIIPRASAFYTTFAILMAQKGLDVEKEFDLIIGNPAALQTFLERRDVAGIMHFEPFSTALTMKGEAKEIATYEDLWRQITGRSLLFVTAGASKEWLDANPKTARKLAQAIAETRHVMRENPDNIKHGLEALGPYGKDPRVVAALKERMMKRIYRSDWDDAAIAAGRWQVEQAYKLKQLDKLPDKELFVKFQ